MFLKQNLTLYNYQFNIQTKENIRNVSVMKVVLVIVSINCLDELFH